MTAAEAYRLHLCVFCLKPDPTHYDHRLQSLFHLPCALRFIEYGLTHETGVVDDRSAIAWIEAHR